MLRKALQQLSTMGLGGDSAVPAPHAAQQPSLFDRAKVLTAIDPPTCGKHAVARLWGGGTGSVGLTGAVSVRVCTSLQALSDRILELAQLAEDREKEMKVRPHPYKGRCLALQTSCLVSPLLQPPCMFRECGLMVLFWCCCWCWWGQAGESRVQRVREAVEGLQVEKAALTEHCHDLRLAARTKTETGAPYTGPTRPLEAGPLATLSSYLSSAGGAHVNGDDVVWLQV